MRGASLEERPARVVLLGLSSVGYRSLALGYLRSWAAADKRLAGRVALETLDLDVSVDAWWAAYRVLGMAPDVLGISVTCWNARSVFEVCRIVRRAAPETVIVLGGPEVGPVAESVLAAHAEVDAVVRGEGEATFAELLYAITRGRDLSRVDGVTARRDDGTIAAAPDRALIADLDDIPSPYLTGVMTPVDGSTYLEGYRGCPHRCAYCFEGKGYGRLRYFSMERIAAEVEVVCSTPGVRTFSFIDPVFNLTTERLAQLADVLAPHAARGVRLHTVEVDIERIGDEAAGQLRRAGVASVETGPQTTGAEALAACHRPFDPLRFSEGVRALKRAGIRVECDLIVGLPGDDVFDHLGSLRFVLGLDPGVIQTSTLHVLPGTDLWEHAGELGIEFDAEPPHEVVATGQVGYRDLRRAEVFGAALGSLYRARL